MRQVLSVVLAFVVAMHLVPTVLGAENVASEITEMKPGTRIEVRLKDKERLRGTRGDVSGSGFTLISQSGGNRQIAFDDVLSVSKKSKVKRNVAIASVIVVGVAAVVVITFVVLWKTKTIGI